MFFSAKQKDFKQAIWDFAELVESYSGNVTALFFYAGHAVQIEGENYLIPVDSKMNQQREIEIEAVNAQSVVNSLSRVTDGVKILILDACRNNPFRSYSRDISGGLAQFPDQDIMLSDLPQYMIEAEKYFWNSR